MIEVFTRWTKRCAGDDPKYGLLPEFNFTFITMLICRKVFKIWFINETIGIRNFFFQALPAIEDPRPRPPVCIYIKSTPTDTTLKQFLHCYIIFSLGACFTSISHFSGRDDCFTPTLQFAMRPFEAGGEAKTAKVLQWHPSAISMVKIMRALP